ncbi:MAG: DUF3300 domain-containing protein [Betaproteobacteria bacterium]
MTYTDRLAKWRPVQLIVLALLAFCALLPLARAQDAAAFKTEELDQMLAPIALYPDSLLSQILMASTYPADVKEAAEWSKAHPDDKGDAAVAKVEGQPWDPSVKSLVAFPQVLAMMREKPGDVQRLGDAFLADPARVMDRVQYLRRKAQEAGNLKSNEQQKVTTQTENNKQVIIVEPAQPQQVYVPVYQPTVVYGTWWYPSYPPYYWPPPAYYYPGAAFVGGMIWGAAIVGIGNSLWGGFGWGNNDVNINVNKYNNINRNNQINNNKFQHNAERRGDVPYRDAKSKQQYGQRQQAAAGARDRDAYRGKEGAARPDARDADRARAQDTLAQRGADPAQGRQQLQGADRDRAQAAVRDTPRADAGGGRGGFDGGNRGAGPSNAMSGVRDSGASRQSMDRGQSSRDSMNRGGGGYSAGSRSSPSARPSGGGGGGRAGGGGGRGGGRR